MSVLKNIVFFKDRSFYKFLLVGVFNTIFGAVIMFFLYNAVSCGYWISSAISYITAGTTSYFLNKYFTFKSNNNNVKGLLKFYVLLIICYLIAFSLAKPVTEWVMYKMRLPTYILEQIAMLAGMGIYSILNYLGQKLWVFKK